MEALIPFGGLIIAVAIGAAAFVAQFFARRTAESATAKAIELAQLGRIDTLEDTISGLRGQIKLLTMVVSAQDAKIKELESKIACQVS